MNKVRIVFIAYALVCSSFIFMSRPAQRGGSKQPVTIEVKPAGKNEIDTIKNKIKEIEEKISDLEKKDNNFLLLKKIKADDKRITDLKDLLSPFSKKIMLLEQMEVSPKELKLLYKNESAQGRQKREEIKKLQDKVDDYISGFRFGDPEYGPQVVQEYRILLNKRSKLQHLLSELEAMYQIPQSTQEEDED